MALGRWWRLASITDPRIPYSEKHTATTARLNSEDSALNSIHRSSALEMTMDLPSSVLLLLALEIMTGGLPGHATFALYTNFLNTTPG